MSDSNNPNILSDDLSVNHTVSGSIQAITKWSKFMGIVSVIFLAFFLLVMVAASSQLSQIGSLIPGFAAIPAALLMVVVFLGVAVIGVLVYFLLRFATLTKRALELRNQDMLNKGLDALKIYFAIYAVLAIIGVALTLINMFTLL